jgi:hypothetical protein
MPRILSVRPVRTALIALVAAIALVMPLSGGSNSAEARAVWCSGDPTILVNGNVVSVTVHVPLNRMRDLDYVEVIFHVPSNADVKLLLNDSLLVPAKTRYVKDQPATRGGLLSPTTIPVEIIAHSDGAPMPIAATTLSLLGRGTSLWTEGTSAAPLWVKTSGLLNLRLF